MPDLSDLQNKYLAARNMNHKREKTGTRYRYR